MRKVSVIRKFVCGLVMLTMLTVLGLAQYSNLSFEQIEFLLAVAIEKICGAVVTCEIKTAPLKPDSKNFHIKLISLKCYTDDCVMEYLGAVVGCVAEFTSKTAWKSNKVCFHDSNGKLTGWIFTRDCRYAMRLINTGDDIGGAIYIINHLREPGS